jgi:hypothetical protein
MKTTIIDCSTGQTSQLDEESPTPDLDAAWFVLRSRRNALLAESDWTVLSDSPTLTAAWKTYRQALRDLPANTTDPTAPDWPTPPA